jgi:hypothetical protein
MGKMTESLLNFTAAENIFLVINVTRSMGAAKEQFGPEGYFLKKPFFVAAAARS